MNKPLISFIIPVFNRATELSKAVDSLLSGDFIGCEIVLINDASTDGSGRVCDEYANKFRNIRAHHNTENLGPGRSRNIGMAVARGRYYFFLDSDDVIKGGSLKVIADLLEKHGDIDILTLNHKTITPCGEREFLSFEREQLLSSEELLEARPSIVYTELWRHFFKADFIKKNRLSLPDASFGEDSCFTCMAYLCAEKTYTLPLVFCVHKCLSDDSLTKKLSRKHYIESFEGCGKALAHFCENHELSKASRAAADLYFYSCITPLISQITAEAPGEAISVPSGQASDFHVDFALYAQRGIWGSALYAWLAILYKARLAQGESKKIILCPAGSHSADIAKNLKACGVAIHTFLDNNCSLENDYLSKTTREFDAPIRPFELVAKSLQRKNELFVIVLGSAQTAFEIKRQLEELGLENGRQFICGL